MEARWRPGGRRMDVILKKSIKIKSYTDENEGDASGCRMERGWR